MRRLQKWVGTRPWAVRIWAVVGLLILPALVVGAAVVSAYNDLASDVVSFVKDAITAVRTGKFP